MYYFLWYRHALQKRRYTLYIVCSIRNTFITSQVPAQIRNHWLCIKRCDFDSFSLKFSLFRSQCLFMTWQVDMSSLWFKGLMHIVNRKIPTGLKQLSCAKFKCLNDSDIFMQFVKFKNGYISFESNASVVGYILLACCYILPTSLALRITLV